MLGKRRMVFVGNPDRGARFQEAVKDKKWHMDIVTEPAQAITLVLQQKIDLIIIDNFPESDAARLVFYRLKTSGKGQFLVLSDSPGDKRFSRLNALSFIRMLKRDPDPNDLATAINDLLKSHGIFTSASMDQRVEENLGRSRGIDPILDKSSAVCCWSYQKCRL